MTKISRLNLHHMIQEDLPCNENYYVVYRFQCCITITPLLIWGFLSARPYFSHKDNTADLKSEVRGVITEDPACHINRSSRFQSQGLPTSPSRCLEVWVNTPPSRTHPFLPHHPPTHSPTQTFLREEN